MTAACFESLTLDHRRGYTALEAAAAGLEPARDGLAIDWWKQPLELQDRCAAGRTTNGPLRGTDGTIPGGEARTTI